MNAQALYIVILIALALSGIWYEIIANIVNKNMVVIGFVVTAVISGLILFLKTYSNPSIPVSMIWAFPYEFAIQFICYKRFASVFGRSPSYKYSNIQWDDFTITPDQMYVFFVLLLGVAPLIVHATSLHNAL
jgi:hypothetical protein